MGRDREILGPFDEVIGATGFRPNLAITRELRLGLDTTTEAPTALAPLTCGEVISRSDAGVRDNPLDTLSRLATCRKDSLCR